MNNIFFYVQLGIFILNIIVFIYLMKEPSLNYHTERIILLVMVTVAGVITFGKVTWLTVLFAFTPFIVLIKIKPHGKFDRFIEGIRDYFRGDKQHSQSVQRSNKALSEQEA